MTRNNKKTSSMRVFVSDKHKDLHLGNGTALQNMFTVNYLNSIRKTIFEQNQINAARIERMLRNGELVIPIMDYRQAATLRAELAKDVFQNELDVKYRIETYIDDDQAKQARLDLSKTYLNKADADVIDGVMQNGFWPLEIFGSTLGENVIIGIMDQAIHLWQEPFTGVNITKHSCDLKNCDIEPTLSLHDFCMHGTYVAGTILKFLPGLKNINGFFSENSIKTCHPGKSHGITSLLYLERSFLTIKKQLQQLERTGKQYAYILNISSTLQSNIDKNLNPTNNKHSNATRARVINIYNMIRQLHQDYPRFQMVVAAGNDETFINDLYRLAPEVMAIGAHTLNFERLAYSNAESDIITATIGKSINTVIKENMRGTSFSSPIMAAMSGIIMGILPDLKNYELRQIIKQLSVSNTEFLANDSPFKSHTLLNPIFIFDLVRFCKLLNKFYSHRIDSQLLKLLNEKSQQFYLEPLSKNAQFRYVIPNNDGNIQFNINDKVGFTVSTDNSGDFYGSIDFCLSSVRIPPKGYDRLRYDFKMYVWDDVLISSFKSITLTPHKKTKIQIEFTRQDDKQIIGRYKKDNSKWSNFAMTALGGGELQNIMLGLKSSPHVQIVNMEPLHSIKTQVKKPLIFSPQKNSTMLPIHHANDYLQDNQQYLDLDPKKHNPTLTKETAILSIFGGLILFTMYLRRKFKVNNVAGNNARTRSTFRNHLRY